jgi:RNA polymerase sigma-70 factor, ECF subfamily
VATRGLRPTRGRGEMGMAASERVWLEQGLRAAVLAGDEAAWQAWYDESYPGLYRYVQWRCGGLRDDADEVVQDTWLTAVRRVRSFDPAAGSFAAWLRGIAANLLRNHFRSRRRRRVETLGQDVADGRPAEEKVRRRAESVARALAALPRRYEEVLRAKYLDGHSVADVAAAWGETPKAVESLLSRARQAFREAYTETES